MRNPWPLFTCGLVLCALPGCGRTAAGLEADRFEHDFPGDTLDPLRTEFTLTNASDAAVEILDVLSSCGCAAPQLPSSRRELQPGESIAIEVRMSRPPIDTQTATLTLETNSPVTPLLEFHLTAHARNDQPRIVTVLPRRLVFGPEPDQMTTEMVATTLENAESSLLSAVESDLPILEVDRLESEDHELPDGEHVLATHRYRVGVRSDSPGGQFSGSIHLLTANDRYRIPVQVTVDARLYAQPDNLFASLEPESDLPRWRVQLMAPEDAGPVRVRSVQSDCPWLRTSLDGTALDVEVSERPPDGARQAEIVVETEAPQRRELRIPVTLISG